MKEKPVYRIKYWRYVNPESGEWVRTGLTTKASAERIAESLRKSHEQVEVYVDEEEAHHEARAEGEGEEDAGQVKTRPLYGGPVTEVVCKREENVLAIFRSVAG